MAQHRPFRLSRSTAGVKDPCEVLWFAIDHARSLGAGYFAPLLVAEHDKAFDPRQRPGQGTGHVGCREADARPAIQDDVGEFTRMQFGVGGHGD